MKSKKYVMIITSENKLYESGEKGLDYFAGHPWEGDLEGIIYGNTFDELFGDGHNEGLFQQTYETETGTRLSYGILDPDTPRTEIEEYEKDKELPPENENWKEFVGKIAKENGWTVLNSSAGYFIFQRFPNECTPFTFSISEVYDFETLLKRIKSIYNSFDVSEEAYKWIDENGHGLDGAPHDMLDVYWDIQNCEDKMGRMLAELKERR